MDTTITFQILRYIPEKDPDPFYQEYEVPFREEVGDS
jgi:succinate dehydrogenase/fumarate reductase-like Fe-S protein